MRSHTLNSLMKLKKLDNDDTSFVGIKLLYSTEVKHNGALYVRTHVHSLKLIFCVARNFQKCR